LIPPDVDMRQYTSEIEFSAGLKSRLKTLGYKASNFEDLLIEIISKGDLSAVVGKLQTAIDSISTDTLPAGSRTFGLGAGSVDGVKITNRSVEYATTGDSFSYSLSNLKDNLPAGFQAVSAKAVVVDANGKQSSVSGLGSKIKVPSFPATAKVTTVVQTPNGRIELEKEILISPHGSGTSTLEVRDFTTAPADLKQRELNELFAAEIALLKQK
jgi:hypothetical protein